MASRDFKEALDSLRIPNFQAGDPSEYEWLFDNEKIVPFLAWFCDQVKFAKDAVVVANHSDNTPIHALEDDTLVECRQDIDTLLSLRYVHFSHCLDHIYCIFWFSGTIVLFGLVELFLLLPDLKN